MRPVSALYLKLLANPEHNREIKAKVAGVEYTKDQISSCSTTGGVVPELTVGNCIARTLSLTIEPTADPPRMAAVVLYTRLIVGEEVSEWIPSGVYYVNARSYNEVSGRLTLKCYDAMRGAEAVWLDVSEDAPEDAGEWPMPQAEAAADIARCMGVKIDPRTSINSSFRLDYPNDLTMREALVEIAAANAGNWSMAGDGKLLLTPLGGLPPETHLLVDNEDGGAILFGSVRIIV